MVYKTKSKYSLNQTIIINSFGVIFLLFTQWLLTITITKINGFSDVGKYTLAVSFTNIFFIIASFNIRSYQISDINSKFSDNTYLVSRVITVLITSLIFVIALLFSRFSFSQVIISSIYFFYRMMDALVDVTQGVFQKKWRIDFVTVSNVLRGLLTYLSFTLALLLLRKLEISMVLLVVSSILVFVFYDLRKLLKLTKLNFKIKVNDIWQLLFACAPLMFASTLTMIASYIPRMEIGKILGDKALGVFAAISIPTLLIQVGAGILVTPLTTHLAEYYARKRYALLLQQIIKFTAIFVLLSLALYFASSFISEPVLKVLYGQEIKTYIGLFQPMILVSILTSFQIFFLSLNVIFRDSIAILLTGIFGIVISSLSSQWLLVKNGLNGAPVILELILVAQILISLIFIVVRMYKDIRSNAAQPLTEKGV